MKPGFGLIVASVVGVMLASCVSRNARSSVRLEDYFPLAVGNSWTYRQELLGQASETTVSVVQVQNGMFVDSKGAKFRFDQQGLRDEQRYLLQRPLETGRSWTVIVPPGVLERYEIVSVHKSCRALSSEFPDCIQVQAASFVNKDAKLVTHFLYARGVGLVSVEVALEKGEQRRIQSRMNLVSFQFPSLTSSSLR